MNAMIYGSEQAETQKQIYLQHVTQLYTDISDWLQSEPLRLKNTEIEIQEVLGRYSVPQLEIQTDTGEVLADMKPTGASVLGAEGLIIVEGWLDKGYVLYLRKNETDSIETDGWYWEEQRLNTPPHFLTKTKLLQLITWVSDYEFV
ncbi:MAG: hypothetical protein KAI83_09385 [Thiomargarita sp.]|nr:hypothetical protein [Thiomargarita sp.]